MGKLKNSTAVAITSQATSPLFNKAAEAQIRADHRKHMIESGILAPDDDISTVVRLRKRKASGTIIINPPRKKGKQRQSPSSDEISLDDSNTWTPPIKNGKCKSPQKPTSSVKPSKKRKAKELDNNSPPHSGSNSNPEAIAKPAKRPRISPRYRRNKEIASTPPSSSPPVLVSTVVALKIKQVREFLAKVKKTKLDRDKEQKHLITVTESDVLGAVMTMRVYFEIGAQSDASLSEVEEAITKRMQGPLFGNPCVDFVTIDASKETSLVGKIREKIAGHGLDSVNLLEVELEMLQYCKPQATGLSKGWRELGENESFGGAKEFHERFQGIWNGVSHSNKDSGDDSVVDSVVFTHMVCKEKEIGRRGVCVAPVML